METRRRPGLGGGAFRLTNEAFWVDFRLFPADTIKIPAYAKTFIDPPVVFVLPSRGSGAAGDTLRIRALRDDAPAGCDPQGRAAGGGSDKFSLGV